jgi:SpoVK/Ycf46/Vps4 family AAA+-type ATPase
MSKTTVPAEPVYTPDSMVPRYSSSGEAIKTALKAHNPIIWVRTHEEARLARDIIATCTELHMNAFAWSMWQGLVPVADFESGVRASGQFDKSWQPPLALDMIAKFVRDGDKTKGNVVIMRDVHVVLQEPIPRQIRDLHEVLVKNRTKLVFVSPHLAHGAGGQHDGLPPTMEKQITVLDFELPDANQINREVRNYVSDLVNQNQAIIANNKMPAERAAKVRATIANLQGINDQHYADFSRAMQGLTLQEIKNTISSSIQFLKTINTKFLLDSKKNILSRSDILEYFDPNRTMNDIGGMDLMKEFFDDYKYSHTDAARDFGVDALRGVIMVGVPGCGKSQMCKAVSASWNLPLIRLDVGKVMTGLVGGSESKMRSAIKQVEAIAPCVLWIDEVEKALSGTKSSNFSDGGTMARVFGTLLTAMEEGLKGVTILATANDIEALPPEFIRRFSECFFVDLPGPDERAEIFRIHLRKKNQNPETFDIKSLISGTDGFTGHEIEKAVSRAMAFAFKDPDKRVKTEHVLQALAETKPISHIMSEKINKMRTEANGKYRYASTWAQDLARKVTAKKEKMDPSKVKLPDMGNKTTKVAESDGTDGSLDIE